MKRTACLVGLAATLVSGTPSIGHAQCLGDFNGDGRVTVDELVTAVDNALNSCQVSGPRFVDNGDGTVTDHRTGLMWEQKHAGLGDFADPHDFQNPYTWSAFGPTYAAADGTAYTDFLARLNSGSSTDGLPSTPITGCFAGHCDWRLPTIVELLGIVDTTQGSCGGGSGPCIDPTFGPTAGASWSTTTVAGLKYEDHYAFGVYFNEPAGTLIVPKIDGSGVRAVRNP